MKDRRRGGDDSQRWLTTYSDLVTLLLAFFVMLFAMSEIDQERFEQLVAGLQGPFGNPGRVASLLPASNGVLEHNPPQLADPATTTTTTTTTTTPAGELPALLLTPDQLLRVRDALEESLSRAGYAGVAEYAVTERGLVVTIATDQLRFASGSAELGEDGHRIIGAIAPVLARFQNPVLVEGHTDDVPYGRPGYDNWNLSADRALAVLHLLTGVHGLDPTRLGAVGYGEHRPLVANRTDADRARNRRVELVVLYAGAEANG